MQKTAVVEIQIDDKTKRSITVKELSAGDLFELLEDNELSVGKIIQDFPSLLPKICDLKIEEIKEFYPSDLKLILDKAKEVNSVFFSMLKATGMDSTLKESMELYKKMCLLTYKKTYAGLLKQDTPEL